MGDAEVTASNWRLVEVGRVGIFAKGLYEGKLVAIVQIIDHKRVGSAPKPLHRPCHLTSSNHAMEKSET